MAPFLWNSPGPKYALPSATGYDGHDPTLTRAPAQTIAPARISNIRNKVPGPKYNCSGMSRKGPFSSREAYLEGKPRYTYSRGPSPQNYGAHLCPDLVHNRPPSWFILGKSQRSSRMSGPAPKYLVPGVVGNQVPHLTSAPQFTILGRGALKIPKTPSPGPGRYARTDLDVFMKKAPTPAVLSKTKVSTRYMRTIPGPKYSCNFNEKIEPPSYSFGVKHSPCQKILYTQQDMEPFFF